MSNYSYYNETFSINQFDQQKPFSSFLPGIAGLRGIPIWAFYANRGQAITCFGIENKDRAILDFQPANLGYQYTHVNGFRTFIKVDGLVYEAFSPNTICSDITRTMQVNRNEITIIEQNKIHEIETEVTYYALPEETFGALVREVRIRNLSKSEKTLEVIDGLAVLLPSGVGYDAYKQMSNLMKSWMDVFDLEQNIPLYRMRAATSDEAEVKAQNDYAGNFFMSIKNGQLLPVIVDPKVIFDFDTTLSLAHGVMQNSVDALVAKKQATVNKVPCGFSAQKMVLSSEASQQFVTMVGYTDNIQDVRQRQNEFMQENYFVNKRQCGTEIIDELVSPVTSKTAYSVFDAYAKQNYLDNVLRGGKPIVFGKGSDAKVYHVYSRKHGDPERDYNYFTIAPEYYSQGNGNFRDVNQNRRNDILFDPHIKAYNIKNFFDLIQLDGYNPLHVKGTRFTLKATADVNALVTENFESNHEMMEQLLQQAFTPGLIINTAAAHNIQLKHAEYEVLSTILEQSDIQFEASFGEGYWIDHWTYNFDLVENFCAIYPDQVEELLFDDKQYHFYESSATVLPRHEKHVLTNNNTVRQYGAIIEHDKEKIEKLQLDAAGTNWVRENFGQGDVYTTTLVEKMTHLIVMKFLSLDPAGIGIEMESDKPGWNDAMNGMPGIFGSGVSESVELLRIARFLKRQLEKTSRGSITFLNENAQVMQRLSEFFESQERDSMKRWEALNTIKEAYRSQVRFGVRGNGADVAQDSLIQLLGDIESILSDGLKKGLELGGGLLPTFLSFEAEKYHTLKDENGELVMTHYNLPAVVVESFKVSPLPHFLEAPARFLKVCSPDEAVDVYQNVKQSDIYDRPLKMYKTSESVEQMSFEIGRARAFTAGWLEREAVFLHMTYKYLLGLLKSGMYDAFYEEIRTNFVCFRDAETYGRSPLENVSFIASSVNPDEDVRGQGFVSRLTGATSEFLSMWNMMMIGKKWFGYANGQLTFTFDPIIAADFFDANNEVSSRLFDTTTITYTNPTGLATYDQQVAIAYIEVDGKRILGDMLVGEDAMRLRNKQIQKIHVFFERVGE